MTARLSELIAHLQSLLDARGDMPTAFIWEGISTDCELPEIYVGRIRIDGEIVEPVLVMDADVEHDKGHYRKYFGPTGA